MWTVTFMRRYTRILDMFSARRIPQLWILQGVLLNILLPRVKDQVERTDEEGRKQHEEGLCAEDRVPSA